MGGRDTYLQPRNTLEVAYKTNSYMISCPLIYHTCTLDYHRPKPQVGVLEGRGRLLTPRIMHSWHVNQMFVIIQIGYKLWTGKIHEIVRQNWHWNIYFQECTTFRSSFLCVGNFIISPHQMDFHDHPIQYTCMWYCWLTHVLCLLLMEYNKCSLVLVSQCQE